MCALKAVALVLVVAVASLGGLYYFQSPSGTWVVDREAMHTEGGDNLLSRVAEALIPDLELLLTDDGEFTLRESGKVILSGNWSFDSGELRFERSPFGETSYTRPGRITIEFVGQRVTFKRQ